MRQVDMTLVVHCSQYALDIVTREHAEFVTGKFVCVRYRRCGWTLGTA